MKKIYLYGKWKMNMSVQKIREFSDEVARTFSSSPKLKEETDFCVFPPFILIPEAISCLKKEGISVGAQTVSEYASGAYTGEVAPSMLAEAGVKNVIVGHSERRHIYGESSETVNTKALSCLKSGLVPVLCVGETLDERDAGKTLEVVKEQLLTGVTDFPQDAQYIIAYEPVWAIGTGRSASPEDAEEVCAFIKKFISVPVLYGGSVKPSNAAELFSQSSVDGGLIGGASMKAFEYLDILRNFRTAESGLL